MRSQKLIVGMGSLMLSFALILGGCNDGSTKDDDSAPEYQEAVAKVDYNGTGATAKQAVFFRFSTGTVTELPRDFFDLAISTTKSANSGVNIIANSGSYGYGVTVLKTEGTDITADLSARSTDVKAYTFRDNYDVTPAFIQKHQTVANPFSGEIPSSGTGSGKVYAVKTETGKYFKVQFNSFGPMGQYKITVVAGLNGTEKKEISGSLSSEVPYGYVYFDLDTQTKIDAAAVGIPKADEWDILCARTNDIVNNEGSPYLAGRSSILINSSQGVRAATVTGKEIEKVLTVPGEGEFSADIDRAIGFKWYIASTNMPPTYSMATNTYIIKTVEGNYAKFHPESFLGPSGEQFYMTFSYLYQPDASGTFSK